VPDLILIVFDLSILYKRDCHSVIVK